jgi:hypothetical protein
LGEVIRSPLSAFLDRVTSDDCYDEAADESTPNGPIRPPVLLASDNLKSGGGQIQTPVCIRCFPGLDGEDIILYSPVG